MSALEDLSLLTISVTCSSRNLGRGECLEIIQLVPRGMVIELDRGTRVSSLSSTSSDRTLAEWVKKVNSGPSPPRATLCDLGKPWLLHLLSGDDYHVSLMEL